MLQSCNYSKILYNLRCTTQAKRFRSPVRLQHHDAESLADSTDRCIVQTVLEITGSTLEEAERLITWKSKGPQARGTLHRHFRRLSMRFPSARSCDWGVTSYSISEIHREPRNFSTASAGNPHPGLVFIRYDFMLVSITRA